MSDIDFDELDKAVNSLMQPKTTTSQPEESAPNTVTDGGESKLPEAGSNSGDDTGRRVVTVNRPSLAVKRRGQFMDIVHPSADMTTQPKLAPTKRSSRSGVSLEPLDSSAIPTANASPVEPPVPQAATTIGAEVSAAPERVDLLQDSVLDPAEQGQPETDATSDPIWPDPIEAMGTEPEADNRNDEDSSVDEANEPGLVDTSDSHNSPFLPDAQVEKRPLGVVDTRQAEDDTALDGDSELGDGIDDFDGATDDEIKPTIPEELQASLMSLEGHEAETDQSMTGATAGLGDSPVKMTSGDADSDASDDLPTTDNKDTYTPAGGASSTPSYSAYGAETTKESDPSIDAQPTPALTTSLPPRQPAQTQLLDADDDPETSIFNTEDKPLKHQTKHSSGWYTIMVIAGMVVIGVLGGVVFYLMTNS